MTPQHSERAEQVWLAAKAACTQAWDRWARVMKTGTDDQKAEAKADYIEAKDKRMRAFYARDPKRVDAEHKEELEQAQTGASDDVAEAA